MKISVIGVGHVGTAIAFSVIIKGLTDELVLVNRNQRRAQAEAADLQHAAAFASRKILVRSGKIRDTVNSDVVIVCISHPVDFSSPIEPRRDHLAYQNTLLFRQWIPVLAKENPDAVFIIVSNPVDVLAYVAWQVSGLPPHRIIGTGTLIDSARYRTLLSEHMHIHPDDIRAYVLGEHGDTQFPALSVALAGGERLEDFPSIDQVLRQTIESGYEVFRVKGYTNFGIALGTSMVIDAIVHDAHRTIPVSTYVDGFCDVQDVFLSLPCVVGREGVVRHLRPPMSAAEIKRFQGSSDKVKGILANLPMSETIEPFPPELL